MKLVEQIYPDEHKSDFKTQYIKYRAGRLKHQYWLWNRKRSNKVVDEYDAKILKNCQPGRTAFFASAGYYLKDIWPHIDAIEMHPVVKAFCPGVLHVDSRQCLATQILGYYDNFAVVNNRGDLWVSVGGLTQHLQHYTQILAPGARLFYSFRDTQIHVNRLTTDLHAHFLSWAQSLQSIGLTLVWHDIQLPKRDWLDLRENPDTTNGNIKFWFVYQGTGWSVI